MTVKEIVSDVILQLTQSDPSDDLALDERQVAFWLTTHANALVTAEINSKLKLGEMVPRIYQTRETCILSELEDTACGDDDCTDRIKLTLTNEVLTLNDDSGIIMVQTDDGDQVLKAGSINNIMLFRHMRFSKPSGDNFVYYTQGSNIFIEGMDAEEIPFDKFHVWYVPKKDYHTVADSTEVVVSDLVLPILIAAMVQTGKAELLGSVPADPANDGVQNISPVYHQQIANPENNQQ